MPMDMHQDMEGCCEDELLLKKIEDQQQLTSSKEAPKADYHLLYEAPFAEMTVILVDQAEEIEVNNTGPPDVPEPGLYILYHNLKLPALQS